MRKKPCRGRGEILKGSAQLWVSIWTQTIPPNRDLARGIKANDLLSLSFDFTVKRIAADLPIGSTRYRRQPYQQTRDLLKLQRDSGVTEEILFRSLAVKKESFSRMKPGDLIRIGRHDQDRAQTRKRFQS